MPFISIEINKIKYLRCPDTTAYIIEVKDYNQRRIPSHAHLQEEKLLLFYSLLYLITVNNYANHLLLIQLLCWQNVSVTYDLQ